MSKSGIKKLAKLGPNLQSLSLNDLSLKAIELGGLISLCPSLKRLELGSDGNESFDEAFNQAGQVFIVFVVGGSWGVAMVLCLRKSNFFCLTFLFLL